MEIHKDKFNTVITKDGLCPCGGMKCCINRTYDPDADECNECITNAQIAQIASLQYDSKYKYEDVITVDAYERTVWLVDNKTTGKKSLHVWHIKAKIEDIVEAYKLLHTKDKYVVYAIDVGMFYIEATEYNMHNGRGVDQDLNVYIEMED